VKRPRVAAVALRLFPGSAAARADAFRLEGVPDVTAEAAPSVPGPGLPSASWTADPPPAAPGPALVRGPDAGPRTAGLALQQEERHAPVSPGYRTALKNAYAIAAMSAASGIVKIQAQTIRWATPHFTADSRRVAPTPMMAPVIVWVVETGIP
jgi:hypothetical protein